jgi:hypothetical protein
MSLVLFFSAAAYAADQTDRDAGLLGGPNLTIATPDGAFSVKVGADLQLRYELFAEGFQPQTSAIYIRRLRPMLEGRLFGDLTFRVIPEMAREASLRDGWIAYRFAPGLSVRAGQFAPPFNWERDGSSDYHQFVERSAANNAFQWADGRDIGVMLDSEIYSVLHIEAGIFNGEGRNAAGAQTTGHLLSGRIAAALFGTYHEIEAMVRPAEEPTFILGAGAYYAFNNVARPWGRFEDLEAHDANVLSYTADAQLTWSRFSFQVAGFYRDVEPAASLEEPFEAYEGYGLTTQASFLLIDRRLLLAMRHSLARPNLDDSREAVEELNVALQLFHRGHASKFHIEAGQFSDLDDELVDDDATRFVRLQYQLLF